MLLSPPPEPEVAETLWKPEDLCQDLAISERLSTLSTRPVTKHSYCHCLSVESHMNFSIKTIYVHEVVSQLSGNNFKKNQTNPATNRQHYSFREKIKLKTHL